jgi:hypothetical protein
MTVSGPLSSGATPPPRAEMSLAEKLACEWEARHDVIARGGRLGDPAALAHYCTHARCEETLHGHGGHPAGHRAPSHGHAPHDPLRSWLRWGEDAR